MEYVDNEGCHWQFYSDYVVIGRCGLCDCGDQSLKSDILRVLTQDGKLTGADEEERTVILKPLDGVDGNYYELILHVLDNAGLIDHGTSIYGSWLTEDGQAVIAMLKKESDGHDRFRS